MLYLYIEFWSNGVKTFFLEDNDGIETGLTFKSGQGEEKRGVRILAMGKSEIGRAHVWTPVT